MSYHAWYLCKLLVLVRTVKNGCFLNFTIKIERLRIPIHRGKVVFVTGLMLKGLRYSGTHVSTELDLEVSIAFNRANPKSWIKERYLRKMGRRVQLTQRYAFCVKTINKNKTELKPAKVIWMWFFSLSKISYRIVLTFLFLMMMWNNAMPMWGDEVRFHAFGCNMLPANQNTFSVHIFHPQSNAFFILTNYHYVLKT